MAVRGDFNEILQLNEKREGRLRPESQMEAFREVLSDCSLCDLGFYGPKYTWSNVSFGAGAISERLDRFLVSSSFIGLFPQGVVKHGVAAYSNHLPIWFESKGSFVGRRKKKQFRFEAMWIGEEKCVDIENVWTTENGDGGHTMESVMRLIKGCGEQLAIWNKVFFGHVKKNIEAARQNLENMLAKDGNQSNPVDLSKTREDMQPWLEREEVIWRQRSRLQWLHEGDQNTCFFHSQSNMRRKRNWIKGLRNEQGEWLEGTQRNDLIVGFV